MGNNISHVPDICQLLMQAAKMHKQERSLRKRRLQWPFVALRDVLATLPCEWTQARYLMAAVCSMTVLAASQMISRGQVVTEFKLLHDINFTTIRNFRQRPTVRAYDAWADGSAS